MCDGRYRKLLHCGEKSRVPKICKPRGTILPANHGQQVGKHGFQRAGMKSKIGMYPMAKWSRRSRGGDWPGHNQFDARLVRQVAWIGKRQRCCSSVRERGLDVEHKVIRQ